MQARFYIVFISILALAALCSCAPGMGGAADTSAPAPSGTQLMPGVPADQTGTPTSENSLMPAVPDNGNTASTSETPAPDGNVTSGGSSSGGGNTNSSGTPASNNQTDQSGQGQSEPANPPGPTVAAPNTSAWQLYKNDAYQFQLRYPPDYVVVPARPGAQPKPLASVWFQDKQLANSQTANLQPPLFAIDIYDNPAQSNVNDWLSVNQVVEANSNLQASPVQIGGVAGVRLTSPLLMAPSTFYYVAHGNRIYELTPLGPNSSAMLSSFAFTK